MKNLTVLLSDFYWLAANRQSDISCNHSFSLCSLVSRADHYMEGLNRLKE